MERETADVTEGEHSFYFLTSFTEASNHVPFSDSIFIDTLKMFNNIDYNVHRI